MQEIEIIGKHTTTRGSPTKRAARSRGLLHPARLAAALGLAPVIRSLNATGAAPAQAAASSTSRGAAARAAPSGCWHTAAAPQHVRAMLLAVVTSLAEILKEGVRVPQGAAASDAVSSVYASALEGCRHLIALTARFGMHALCEDAVSMLCVASGVFSPAPHGSPQEARQVRALEVLIAIALGPDGLHLGAAWWLVLRVLSILEAIVDRACAVRAAQTVATGTLTSSRGASASDTPRSGPLEEHSMFSTVLAGLGAMFGPAEASSSRSPSALHKSRAALFASPRRSAASTPVFSTGPGAGHLRWAQLHDDALDAIYARSAALDGDGVVLFMQSLCSVSTQELQPLAGAQPRVTALQRLTECLLANMDRIRLVWSRIWVASAPQFVAAACHEDSEVALVAVNALRQVVARLLQRAELEGYQWQGATLLPFVDIVRHAGASTTRCLALNCIQSFMQTQAQQLGSGWSPALLAVEVALVDEKLAVLEEGVAALAAAVTAAEADGPFLALLPHLLGLSALATTNEWHPHRCFAGFKCIQQVEVHLLDRRIGMLVRICSPRLHASGCAVSHDANTACLCCRSPE